MMRLLQLFLMAAFMAACAPKGYTPYYATPGDPAGQPDYDEFTLKRTACFGFCPVYDVTVYENDVLIFHGEGFVAETGGAVSKRLPKGSFKKLIDIAKAHEFSEYDARYPNEAGDNCGPIPTDMPSIIISFDSSRLDHEVNLYQGCNFDGRENFDEMVLEMDAVLGIEDWIGPREDFYGKSEG